MNVKEYCRFYYGFVLTNNKLSCLFCSNIHQKYNVYHSLKMIKNICLYFFVHRQEYYNRNMFTVQIVGGNI